MDIKMSVNPQNMKDISSQFDLAAYLHSDPDTFEENVVLRIYKKGDEEWDGIGLTIGRDLSKQILDRLDDCQQYIEKDG